MKALERERRSNGVRGGCGGFLSKSGNEFPFLVNALDKVCLDMVKYPWGSVPYSNRKRPRKGLSVSIPPLDCVGIPLPKNIEDKTTRSFKIFEGFQGTFYKKFPEWGLGQRPK